MLCLTMMLPEKGCSGSLIGGVKDPSNLLLDDAFSGTLCLTLLYDLNCTAAGSSFLSNTNKLSLSA